MEEIKTIRLKEPNYPRLLKKIKDPPQILYYRGDLSFIPRALAVVGTRRCSDYGKQATLTIVPDLTRAGLIIISGLAWGIDTWAHQACLENNGRTIAVLGTGIDEKSIYPKENLTLARKIVEKKGALISEFPAGTYGARANFPKRNRIISGLSSGVLVVEAREKSGALITARWAREQKRKVFAIPGPLTSLNSRGPNWLIKTGAKLVQSAEDILEELDLAPLPKTEMAKGKTPEEQLILDCLKGKALQIDKIIEKTRLSPASVASCLTLLEIDNKVKNLGGNVYARSH